jgi:hypothetical protein
MRRRALVLGVALLTLLVSCGGGSKTDSKAASKAGPTYKTVDDLAKKIAAGGLGCTALEEPGFEADTGAAKPKQQKACTINKVYTTLQVYSDAKKLKSALDSNQTTTCRFTKKGQKTPYDVRGANWYVGTAYDGGLAKKLAKATGGKIAHTKC